MHRCLRYRARWYLMQERNGRPHPIAYASGLCTAAQINDAITELETLAVMYCLDHFPHMMLRWAITAWTDHTAVHNLAKRNALRERLAGAPWHPISWYSTQGHVPLTHI